MLRKDVSECLPSEELSECRRKRCMQSVPCGPDDQTLDPGRESGAAGKQAACVL